MISVHDEIEAKLSADEIDLAAFQEWMQSLPHLERFEHVEGRPDDYYECGSAVVRHRGIDGEHELTVKRRKSDTSTRDREEIDLTFSDEIRHESVGAFLRATGYKLAFRLLKDVYIWWVQPTTNITLVYAIYDVWSDDEGPEKAQRFIEVEAEKGSNVQPETAKRYVRQAVAELQRVFGGLGEPLNQSLYELFSGKTYSLV